LHGGRIPGDMVDMEVNGVRLGDLQDMVRNDTANSGFMGLSAAPPSDTSGSPTARLEAAVAKHEASLTQAFELYQERGGLLDQEQFVNAMRNVTHKEKMGVDSRVKTSTKMGSDGKLTTSYDRTRARGAHHFGLTEIPSEVNMEQYMQVLILGSQGFSYEDIVTGTIPESYRQQQANGQAAAEPQRNPWAGITGDAITMGALDRYSGLRG